MAALYRIGSGYYGVNFDRDAISQDATNAVDAAFEAVRRKPDSSFVVYLDGEQPPAQDASSVERSQEPIPSAS